MFLFEEIYFLMLARNIFFSETDMENNSFNKPMSINIYVFFIPPKFMFSSSFISRHMIDIFYRQLLYFSSAIFSFLFRKIFIVILNIGYLHQHVEEKNKFMKDLKKFLKVVVKEIFSISFIVCIILNLLILFLIVKSSLANLFLDSRYSRIFLLLMTSIILIK